jgi:hypothetical protein
MEGETPFELRRVKFGYLRSMCYRPNPMDWITEQIAVGNFVDALLLPPEVDVVLCLKPGCCEHREDVEMLYIPLIDGSGNNPARYIEAVAFIQQCVAERKRILVHCHAGKSRSVCMVARYFMESEGITREAALARVSDKREIYLTPGIEEIFETMKV